MHKLWFPVLLLGPSIGAAQTGGGAATATGISRDFNPAISVNGLFLGSGFSGLEETGGSEEGFESGMRIQEIEFKFSAAIDPYTSADFVLSFGDDEIGIEEAAVQSGVLSHGIGLRAGQVFVPWGHENPLHTHQLPFVERSLFATAAFDGEALTEFGLEASWVPALPWFVEIRGAAFNGDNAAVFDAPGDWDLAYLGGVDALWDVSEGGTFSLAGAYLGGANASGTTAASTWSHLGNGVLRYKWRSPRRPKLRAFELLGEYQYLEREASTADEQGILRGTYGYALLQFARRWWVQGRYDFLNDSGSDGNTQRASFMLAFVPTEFSALRLQTSFVDAPQDRYTEYQLQLNFVIGSHPAHKY